jgi:phosphoribosylformylglycinamidine synthase
LQVFENIGKLDTEKCFHVELATGARLTGDEEQKLKWILKNPQEKENLSVSPALVATGKSQALIEVGPRFNFSTADSTNSVSICHSAQLTAVKRIEVSIRYLVTFDAAGDFAVTTRH